MTGSLGTPGNSLRGSQKLIKSPTAGGQSGFQAASTTQTRGQDPPVAGTGRHRLECGQRTRSERAG